VSASTVFNTALSAICISAELTRYRIVPYKGPIRHGVKFRQERHQYSNVTNRRNGSSTIRTSAPDPPDSMRSQGT
jgi:hypothetical protein